MSEPIVSITKGVIAQGHNIILSGVNLTLYPGEFVYLVGKTGSGKSSLLKTLYANISPKEGEASICGFDLNKIKTRNIPFLRRKLGIVFQDFELLTDRNVDENLRFVLRATGWKNKREMEVRIEQVLNQVGLDTKGYKMPHELSGGEQQRVVIARALLNNPEIILADEPTGNLDPTTTEGILNLLYAISKTGTTVLMATHDYNFIKQFSARILICEDGKLSEATTDAPYFSQYSI